MENTDVSAACAALRTVLRQPITPMTGDELTVAEALVQIVCLEMFCFSLIVLDCCLLLLLSDEYDHLSSCHDRASMHAIYSPMIKVRQTSKINILQYAVSSVIVRLGTLLSSVVGCKSFEIALPERVQVVGSSVNAG